MSSDFKNLLFELDKAKDDTIGPELMLKQKFDNMFICMREGEALEEERVGLHASAVIKPEEDFCLRQQVLSLVFKMSQGKDLPVASLKIFAAGSSIHEKWQNMFKQCSGKIDGFKLVRNEARSYSKKWNMYFTPDSIIEINGIRYIVEIKSMNTFSYKKAVTSSDPHPHARHQIQLYMHLTGIHHGLILCEDKNTQDYLIHPLEYNYKEVVPYLKRMAEIQECLKKFLDDGKLPKCKCKNETCQQAVGCNMHFACFHTSEAERI